MRIICYDLILMSDPLETAELLAFAQTVDAKSLSRAAAELAVPRATISRRLARLEERLGARLLKRTTRSLVLTDAGEQLYRHARIVLDAVGQAEASVRRTDETVRGDLRVSIMPMINASFNEMVIDFAAQHPELRVSIHSSSQLVDLKRDAYDVVIRASSDLEPGLVVRTLARDPVIVVGAPDYLERHGTPRTRRDLARHRCIMGLAHGDLPQTHWPAAGGGKVYVEGAFFTNDMLLRVHAAVRGQGLAMLPLIAVRSFLDVGSQR